MPSEYDYTRQFKEAEKRASQRQATLKPTTTNNSTPAVKKASFGNKKYSMDKATYDRYDNEFKSWSKTGKFSDGASGWFNQDDRDTFAAIHDSKRNGHKTALVGDKYYAMPGEDYKKYDDEYRSWSKSGTISDSAEAWFTQEGRDAFAAIHDNAGKEQPQGSWIDALDQDVLARVAENYKGSWVYDITDPEDMQRQTVGQPPKNRDSYYNFRDPTDVWLYERGLPSNKSRYLSKEYDKAVGQLTGEKTKADAAQAKIDTEAQAKIDAENAYIAQFNGFMTEYVRAKYASQDTPDNDLLEQLAATGKYDDVVKNFSKTPDETEWENRVTNANGRKWSYDDLARIYAEATKGVEGAGATVRDSKAVQAEIDAIHDAARGKYKEERKAELVKIINEATASGDAKAYDAAISEYETIDDEAAQIKRGSKAQLKILKAELRKLRAFEKEGRDLKQDALEAAQAGARTGTPEYLEALENQAETTGTAEFDIRAKDRDRQLRALQQEMRAATDTGDVARYNKAVEQYMALSEEKKQLSPKDYAKLGADAYNRINQLKTGGEDIFNALRGVNDIRFDTTSEFQAIGVITPEEMREFNRIAEAEGAEAAGRYYKDKLQPLLNERILAQEAETNSRMALEHPVAASALTVAANLTYAPAEGGAAIAHAVSGTYGSNDNLDMIYTEMNSQIRGDVAARLQENGGVVPAFLYQTGMSMADSLARLPMGTGGLVLMATGVAGATINDAIKDGATCEQALVLGVIAGGIEYATEKLSLDTLLATKSHGLKGALLQIFKTQGLTEAGEEAISEIVNMVADSVIMADDAKLKAIYDSYIQGGMTNGEAIWATMWDATKQVGGAALGGYMSGIFFGMGGQVASNYSTGVKTGAEKWNAVAAVLKGGKAALEYDAAIQRGTVAGAEFVQTLASDLQSLGLPDAEVESIVADADNLRRQPAEWVGKGYQTALLNLGKIAEQNDLRMNRMNAEQEARANAAGVRLAEGMAAVRNAHQAAAEALSRGDLQAHTQIIQQAAVAMENYTKAFNAEKDKQVVAKAAHDEHANKAQQAVRDAAVAVHDAIEPAAEEQIQMAIGIQFPQLQGMDIGSAMNALMGLDTSSQASAGRAMQSGADAGDVMSILMGATPSTNAPQSATMDMQAALMNSVEAQKGSTDGRGLEIPDVRRPGESGRARQRDDGRAGAEDQGRPRQNDARGQNRGAEETERTQGESRTSAASGDRVGYNVWSDEAKGDIKDLVDDFHKGFGRPELTTEDVLPVDRADPETERVFTEAASFLGSKGAYFYQYNREKFPSTNGLFHGAANRDRTREYVELTGDPAVDTFNFGHEAAENRLHIREAVAEALSGLGSYQEDVFAQYLDSRNAGTLEGDAREELRKEMYCDAYGAYVSETLVDDDGESPFHTRIGFSDSVWELLVPAMEAARQAGLDVQQELGDTEFSRRSMLEALNLDMKKGPAGDIVITRNGRPVTSITEEDVRTTRLGALIKRAVDRGFITEETAKEERVFIRDLTNILIKVKDVDMVWAWAGTQAFSAITSNSDPQYSRTVDFTTICRKTQAIIDAMSAKMLELGRGLTEDEILSIQGELAKKGELVPCPGCYVFARWTGIGGVLDKMKTYQDKYTGMTDAEIREILANGSDESANTWLENVRLADGYKPVPGSILFDLNKGGEFAQEYPESWKYRTTRGPAMGKAMTPYAEMRVGEVIQGMRKNQSEILKGKDNPFFVNNGEELSKNAAKEALSSERFMAIQNLLGGLRYQSTSDFRYDYALDYLLSLFDVQAVGGKIQTYTKVPDAVPFLARVGADVNVSVWAKGDGIDKNGELAFSPIAGMDINDAVRLSETYDNAQIILVGISDAHIELALGDRRIGFVIPYHASGAKGSFVQAMARNLGEDLDSNTYTNYELVQGDKDDPNSTPEQTAARDLRLRILTGAAKALSAEDLAILDRNQYLSDLYDRFYVEGVDKDTYQNFLRKAPAGIIMPFEYWDTSTTLDTADENGRRFMDYCSSLGLIPRFSGKTVRAGKVVTLNFGDFTGMDGYWKTLIDRPMYNNDGSYHVQQKINVSGATMDMLSDTDVAAFAGAQSEFSTRELPITTEQDRQYLDAVKSGDMETAQKMVDEAADKQLASMLLPDDSDEEGFKYHRGKAPTKTFKRYAVFNVSADGFKAAYAGNKTATPVGVWIDAQNLRSYMSDITQFDDGTFASYIPGDTGHLTTDKFSEELTSAYELPRGQRWLLERGGKHSTDVPNFSQMNLKQNENGEKVASAKKDGALPHNKLIFEIEYGTSDDGDLTEYVRENGRIMKGQNQGLAKIQPNQFYDFKTNSNAVGNWGLGGTFRIVRLVPHEEVVSVTEQYKANAIKEAQDLLATGQISKADMQKRVKNAEAIQVQKWVGGYRPEDFGLSVDAVEELYKAGQKKKLTDAVTYDDNGEVIPLSQRFNSAKADIRYSTRDIEPKDAHALGRGMGEIALRKQKQESASSLKDLRKEAKLDMQEAMRVAKTSALDAHALGRGMGEIEMRKQKQASNAALRDLRQDMQEAMKTARTEKREAVAAQRESDVSSFERSKILARVDTRAKALRNLITRPQKGKTVPLELQEPIMRVLASIDYTGAKGGRREADRWESSLLALSSALRMVNKGDAVENYTGLPEAFIEEVENLANSMGETNEIAHMTSDQLKRLDNVLAGLHHRVINANKLLAGEKYKTIEEAAEPVVRESEAHRRRIRSNGGLAKLVGVDMMDSYSFFHALGKGGEAIYEELNDGFLKSVSRVRQTTEFMDELKEKHGFKTRDINGWGKDKHTIDISGGRAITLTTGQIMELYALSHRAQGLQHILSGGIEVGEHGKNVLLNAAGVDARDKTSYPVTESDVRSIVDRLTDQQKAFVTDLQQYLSTTAADWGNETFLRMNGYARFGEENYWPISASGDKVNEPAMSTMMNAIANAGFTKALNAKATNPVRLNDAMDTFVRHCSQMATYNGMAVAIDDAMKWVNYHARDEQGNRDYNRTTKKAIEKILGRDGIEYFINLIKDINGLSQGGTGTEIPSKLIANYKKAAVGAKLRVVIQQPTSIIRAAAMIDPKYFAHAGGLKANRAEMLDKAPIAWWKAQGNYEIGIGKTMRGIIVGSDGAMNAISDAAMKPAGWADDLAWAALWGAVKNEVRETNPEDFDAAVVKRFTDIVNRTQVVDNVLNRSQLMRSKDKLAQTATAFLSEPAKAYNMLRNAAMDALKGGDDRAKRQLFRTIVSVFLALVVNAGAKGLFDSLTKRKKGETVEEGFKEGLKASLEEDLNPLTYIPYVRDAYALARGDSVERMDLSGVSDLVYSVKQAYELLDGDESTNPTASNYKVFSGLAKGVSSVTGLPLNGLLSSIESMINVAAPGAIRQKRLSSEMREHYDALVVEGVDDDLLYTLMTGKISGGTNAQKALSIVTSDIGLNEDELDSIGHELFPSYEEGHLEDWAVEQADAYKAKETANPDNVEAIDALLEKLMYG